MRNRIEELLSAYDDLEEVLNELDITAEEVIDILLKGGYVVLPSWLNDVEVEEIEQ